MDPTTPKKTQEVQVPESSPIEEAKVPSSSPLVKNSDATASFLRDRFVYRPTGSNSGSVANNTGISHEASLSYLTKEFPDFSETLIKAVFKSNSFNLNLARERLSKIQSQKSSRSWAWQPGDKLSLIHI